MARAAQQAPPISVGWLIVTLGVAGVPVATYYGYPGMAALWLGIVLAGWAEPRPVFTGPKDRSGAPTPAGPREEKAKRRYFLYSDLRWRMLCPNLDWLPGWPPLAAWFFALAAAVAATLLPTSELKWGWVNAAATFITIAQLAGSRRRTLTPYDPNPGVRFNSLGHIPALRPTVLGAVAAGIVSALVVLVLLGRGLVTWPTVLPGIAYAGAAAVSAALAVCWSQWKNTALESWRARVAARAEWEPRWQVALPNVNKTGAPQLVAHRQLGSLTIDTFDAPPELGARGLIGLKPKVVAAIGGGYSVTILSSPNLDSQGQPMPGTEHPLRVEVITYPSDSPPDVTDPAIDPEEAAYAISSALSHAVDAYGGGGAQFIFIDIEPVHVPPPPDDSPTGWKRLWSTATPAARTAATEESEQSGTEDEVAEGPAPSQGAVWALRYGGMNSITYVRRQYAGMMPAHLGDHVEVLVNDWPEGDPHHPGGGRIYVGAITSPSTVYQDEGTIQMLSNIMEEDRWNERWGGVLKTGANQPEPQFAVAKDATLGRTQLHALPFTIKQGEQVGDFEKLEPKLATTLMAAPFVSIVGYPGPGGRPGDRHPQAFEVRWSDGPVPASADRLPPSKTISQVSSTTKAPEHWVLAGQINAAFDNARLARPEVISARPLTRPGGASGHLWQVEMRLYGGVSLSDVRAKMSRIASSLSTPWIQVTPSKQPQCLVMVLGADYRKAKLADPKRSMPYLADLEWQQAWVDANLVNSQGLAPTMIESATLETNEKVQVLDFELPSGITRSRIKGAIEKLKGSTRNEFVEVRAGVHGANSARLLVSREDPMPFPAPINFDFVHSDASAGLVPFATGVEGEPVSWNISEDPHLLIVGGSGSGKAQPLNTPIPVPVSDRFPDGWATVGTLEVGDAVFAGDGSVTRVVGFTSTRPEQTYVVTFSDGQEVRTSAHHMWRVSTVGSRFAHNEESVARRAARRTELLAEAEKLEAKAAEIGPEVGASLSDISALAGLNALSIYHMDAVPRSLGRTVLVKTKKRAAQYEMDAVLARMRSIAEARGHFTFCNKRFSRQDIDDLQLDGKWLSLRAITEALLGRTSTRQERDLLKGNLIRRCGAARREGNERRLVLHYPVDEVLTILAQRLRNRADGRVRDEYTVLTTAEMAEQMAAGYKGFAVPVTGISQPDADLPLDPYVLGAWLGDGDSSAPRIVSADPEIIENIVQAGHEVTGTWSKPGSPAVQYHIASLRAPLSAAMGKQMVDGHGPLAKFVPPAYLRASRRQRLALLQGLMDTDGTVGEGGSCELTLCNEDLATSALELIRSLGIKASMTQGPACITEADPEHPGATRRREVGTRWRIGFTTTQPVFRLSRKAARLPSRTRGTAGRLYVSAIRLDSEEEMRCIRVEHPEHTYLTDGFVTTHNSATLQMLLYSMLDRGWDVHIADPVKAGADFRFAAPWLKSMTFTIEETSAMMDAVYAEVQRRRTLNGQYGVGSYRDLPEDIRPRHSVIIIDEFTSLILADKPKKPSSSDPEVLAAYEENLQTVSLVENIGGKVGRIVREARSAGITLVLATQRLTAKELESIPGGNTIRTNMSRMLLGKSTYGERQSALKDPDSAPDLGDVVPQGRGLFETAGHPIRAIQSWYDHPIQEVLTEQLTQRVRALDDEERLDLEPFMPKLEKQTVEGAILSAPGEGAILSSAEPEVTDLGEIDLDLDDLDLSDVELDDEEADAPDPGPADGELVDEGETGAPAPPGEDVRLLVAGDDPTAAELGADFVLLTSEPGAADEEFVVPPESLLGHPKLDALSELIETRSPTHLVWVDSEHGATDDMGVPLTEAIDELAGDHGCRVLVLAAPDAKAVARFAGITPPALALDTGAGPAFEVEEAGPSVPAAPTAPEPSGDEEDDELTFDVPEPQPRRPEPAVEEFDFESGEDTAPAEPRPTRSEPAHLLGANEEEFSF